MATSRDTWEWVNELFSKAVELDPTEREKFLVEACAGNSALRTEVESLLEFDQGNEHFIEAPAFVFDPNFVAAAFDQHDPVAMDRIGPYRVVKEIGRGGMGAVYLAKRDDEAFRKRVAIKLVKRGLDTEDILRHFRHERQILASLDHPNIAKLLDGGTTNDGRPYLVMDYVEGTPLKLYCDEQGLKTEDRLRLFLAVCSAVQYAHQNLIVHRDLKPSNVLVTIDGVPKLLDFGIAKLLDAGNDGQESHTVTQLGVMTPEYASPEQVRGEQVTTATDVYSLGVLLYELLTGRRPYRITSRRPEDVGRVICEQEPLKPSTALQDELTARSGDGRFGAPTKDGESSRPSVSQLKGDLDNIALMALRKEPLRRYASVAQFADDIQRHLDGLPVTARTDTIRYRTSKFIQRHKLGVTAAAIVVIALAAGFTLAIWQAKVASEQRDRALAEAGKAEQLNRFLREMLSSADPGAGGKDVTVALVLNEAAKRVQTEFEDQPETAAALRSTIGMTYLGLGLYDEAEPHLRSALETRRRLFGSEHPEVANSMNDLGELLTEKGDLALAEELYRSAIEISRRTRGPEHADTAGIMHNLAALLLLKGELEDAERVQRETLAIRRRALGNDHIDVAQSLNDLGVILGTRGNFAEAEGLHREALAICQKAYGQEHLTVAATMATLATVLEEKGNHAEAEDLYQKTLAMRRKLLGSEHPSVAWTLYNYSYMLQSKGDYQKAIELAREVVALRDKTLNDNHPMIASSLQVIGRSLMGQGDAKTAEQFLRESLTLRRRTMPAGHWLIAASESLLGGCLAAQKRYLEAESLLVSGFNGLKDTLGEQHPRTVEASERLTKFRERAVKR